MKNAGEFVHFSIQLFKGASNLTKFFFTNSNYFLTNSGYNLSSSWIKKVADNPFQAEKLSGAILSFPLASGARTAKPCFLNWAPAAHEGARI